MAKEENEMAKQKPPGPNDAYHRQRGNSNKSLCGQKFPADEPRLPAETPVNCPVCVAKER